MEKALFLEGEEPDTPNSSPTKSINEGSVIFTTELLDDFPEIRQGEYMRTEEDGARTHFVHRAGHPTLLQGFGSVFTTPKKRCVVFVHGLGFCNQSWEGFEDSLISYGVSTLSYDLMGRGLSDPGESYTVQSHVEQLYNVVLTQIDSYDSIEIVGHSLGGAIALGFGAEHAGDTTLKGKIKSIHAIAPAGMLSMPSLCLIQHLPILNLVFYPFLMNMPTQRAAWMADHENTESDECKKIVNLQEALHADPARSSKISYAIWRTLEDFQLTNIHDTAQALATRMRIEQEDIHATEKLQVKIIWGTADTVCPFSSAGDWETTFKGVENFELVPLEGRAHSVVQCDLASVVAATKLI